MAVYLLKAILGLEDFTIRSPENVERVWLHEYGVELQSKIMRLTIQNV